MRDRLYSVSEAARAMHMSTPAARQAIDHGTIWAITLGRATRVSSEELERVRENVARRKRIERKWAQWDAAAHR